jgi:SAM-dependent methyltransferase
MNDVSLSDAEYVKSQYLTTANLEIRSDVWRNDIEGEGPQDVAEEALREVTPRLILEVGAGRGIFAARMQNELSARVIAIDTSSAMVDEARLRGVETILADVREMPFEDRTFDAVVAAWMLYHVDPVKVGLREIARVLRPGGRLVAITNGRDHLSDLWSLVGEQHEEPAFSKENGRSLLESVFTRVQRHDIATHAEFSNRSVAAGYLASVNRGDLAARLPVDGWPMRASGATTVFVADLDRPGAIRR